MPFFSYPFFACFSTSRNNATKRHATPHNTHPTNKHPYQPNNKQGWQNKVLARFVLETLAYNPLRDAAGRVAAPVFLRCGEADHLAPPKRVRAAAARMAKSPEVVVQELKGAGHIEAHVEGAKEENFGPMLSFLRRHLGVSDEDAAAADAFDRALMSAAAEAGGADGGGGGGGAGGDPAADAAAATSAPVEGQFPIA